MSSPEPIVFVPDEKGDYGHFDYDRGIVKITNNLYMMDRYRRLPPGWLDEAVERVKDLYSAENRKHGGGDFWHPASPEILAALFPPPEPEPEEWEREAAKTWFGPSKAIGMPLTMDDAEDALARHFAKARRERGKP